MVKCIGPRDPKDRSAINTTSTSKDWSRGLSPFFVGPVPLYGGRIAKNLENAWQYSKVYGEHNDNGKPSDGYWTWAEYGWKDTRAQRYPMGKGKKPLYSWWDGEKLTYIEARNRIYIPLYAEAVRKTGAYQTLKSLYETFGEVTLWDFDAYDHRMLGMSWDDVRWAEDRKMGHALVLAMMLEGVI